VKFDRVYLQSHTHQSCIIGDLYLAMGEGGYVSDVDDRILWSAFAMQLALEAADPNSAELWEGRYEKATPIPDAVIAEAMARCAELVPADMVDSAMQCAIAGAIRSRGPGREIGPKRHAELAAEYGLGNDSSFASFMGLPEDAFREEILDEVSRRLDG
jgi:hypothetical protein